MADSCKYTYFSNPNFSIALWAVEKSGILSSKFWTKAVSVNPGHMQLRVMPWAAISACFFRNRKIMTQFYPFFPHRCRKIFSSIYTLLHPIGPLHL